LVCSFVRCFRRQMVLNAVFGGKHVGVKITLLKLIFDASLKQRNCHMFGLMWSSGTAIILDISWSWKVNSSLPETYTAIPATGNVTCEVPLSTVDTFPVASDIKPFQHLCPWLSVVESAAEWHLKTWVEEQPNSS